MFNACNLPPWSSASHLCRAPRVTAEDRQPDQMCVCCWYSQRASGVASIVRREPVGSRLMEIAGCCSAGNGSRCCKMAPAVRWPAVDCCAVLTR